MKQTKGMALIWVMEAVDRALRKYSAENVDVMVNEETGRLDVIYHDEGNSFPIEMGVAAMAHVNKKSLVKELNLRKVGYCW